MAANLDTTDSSFVQMVILTDRQKVSLTEVEAYEIGKHIFNRILAIIGKRSPFKGRYVFSEDDGAIIINTHVDSVDWLKGVVASYNKKALTVTDIKNSPQYTAKVKADVTQLDSNSVDNLLYLLEAHNYGLKTHGWKIMSVKPEYIQNGCFTVKRKSVTILIDDPGWKMLEKNGFKLFADFFTLTFNLLGRVKRSETTGIICKDEV